MAYLKAGDLCKRGHAAKWRKPNGQGSSHCALCSAEKSRACYYRRREKTLPPQPPAERAVLVSRRPVALPHLPVDYGPSQPCRLSPAQALLACMAGVEGDG